MSEYGRTNFVIQLGTDWSRVLAYQNPDGSAVNITGYHAAMQVRPTAASSAVILDLDDQTKGGITINGTAGTITISLASAAITEPALDLSTITASPEWLDEFLDDGSCLRGFGKIAAFDLDLIAPSGAITRLVQGHVVFDPEVTR